jgi:hypothetical protein
MGFFIFQLLLDWIVHLIANDFFLSSLSHSMQSNAFSLISVSPVRSRDSESTDYLYSPCSTASVYHFFISVIKRLFCCGLRGLFPWIHYSFSPMLKQAFSIILCI